ncbi:AAA family ATPase [Helicobacter sp. 23-1046]
MLIEFRVKNFHSIQDEQVFSLVASSQKQHANNTFQIKNEKLTLLKSVAIYGANAAGKSNLIKAFAVMNEIVIKSAIAQRNEKLPILPFLLGQNKNEPTEFEMSFLTQGVRYRYGFSATNDRVLKEWLFAYPNGRMQQFFLRTYDEKSGEYIYEDRNLTGEKKLWEKSTRENALFLSTAIQLNNQQLKPIFDWFFFLNISTNSGDFANSFNITIDTFQKQPKELIDYLKAVDLDIENLKIEKQDFEQEAPSNIPKEMREQFKQFSKVTRFRVKTTHTNQQGKHIDFNIELESEGTQKFFTFLGPVLETLRSGRILIIDELHNHLHPSMTRFIIELFHNDKINTKNAQLIFTTHETSVLNKDIFRKDQIYFCEKQNKATKIYSMSDFKGLREHIDYEKSYLLGRFGALPRLKSING